MLKTGIMCAMALLMSGSGIVSASDLATSMRCKVTGSGGCSGDICVGGGIKDPAVKLYISRLNHSLSLNGIDGKIDDGNGDPYAGGNHKIRWKHGLITFRTYRLNKSQPGRVSLTLNNGGGELEFHCLGS